MPHRAGRSQSCQACHPVHWQNQTMNDLSANPYVILDQAGNPRFSDQDLRLAGGGCYLRRDAHDNPEVQPPFFLNAVGRWYLHQVNRKDEEGKTAPLPSNPGKGAALSYAEVSGGSDWWLSPSEPHCADCHLAPFVESEGGSYFPIDQPGKYALYRYSKAHGALACQTCHQSMHGLYPVRYDGEKATVDLTSRQQALQFSPDGSYAGPVTCPACHTVNHRGGAGAAGGDGL